MRKIILQLLILAGVAGGIFYAHRLKTAAEARQLEKIRAEKLARQEREAREAEEREARKAQEQAEREAREREVKEAREREEKEAREREAREAREREEKETREREAREANRILTSFNSRIDDLRKELKEFRIIRNDPFWQCFDLCITFSSVTFFRTMHSSYVDVGPGIYYVGNGTYSLGYVKLKKSKYLYFDTSSQRIESGGQPRSHRVGQRIYWEKVPVNYFCKRHRVLWSPSMVENYKPHYISIRDIERREREIYRELNDLETKKNLFLKKQKISSSAARANSSSPTSSSGNQHGDAQKTERRNTISETAPVLKALVIEMGLDNRICFRLSGENLIVDNGSFGGVGTHHDLPQNYPRLYFGSHKCYANGQVWDLTKPLALGFVPEKIARVELLECGRSQVSVGAEREPCHITWTDNRINVTDDELSSSRYVIKILFLVRSVPNRNR